MTESSGNITDTGGPCLEVDVLTWNVNGLLDWIKRGAVLRYFKRLGTAVAMLQEMHLMGTKFAFLVLLSNDSIPRRVCPGLQRGYDSLAQISPFYGN